MFKQIVIDDQATLQAIVAFVITTSVFAVIMLKAWRMRHEDAEHLSQLPLDNTPETHHSK